MDKLRALGLLITGAINNALMSVDPEDPKGRGCCKQCCGPCAALDWYRNEEPHLADQAVMATGHRGYDWQTPSGRIDWYQLDEIWTRGMCEPGIHDEEA